MKRFLNCTLCVLVLLASDFALAQSVNQKPGILIAPTRVVMEGKQRSASITIANNGNKEGRYRIEIVNKRMDERGAIKDAEEAMEGELFAEDILRISPRRVTIPPGGHQSIRILARKPKGLAEAEYRSHLRVMVLPDEGLSDKEIQKKEEEPVENTLTISIKANFGVTIPVIVRNGDLEAGADIRNLSLNVDSKTGRKHVLFDIYRNGKKSLYGDIDIVYFDESGKEYVLKHMGGLAVYTPNKFRKFDIALDVPDGLDVKKGRIEVMYLHKEEAGGKVIANSNLTL